MRIAKLVWSIPEAVPGQGSTVLIIPGESGELFGGSLTGVAKLRVVRGGVRAAAGTCYQTKGQSSPTCCWTDLKLAVASSFWVSCLSPVLLRLQGRSLLPLTLTESKAPSSKGSRSIRVYQRGSLCAWHSISIPFVAVCGAQELLVVALGATRWSRGHSSSAECSCCRDE